MAVEGIWKKISIGFGIALLLCSTVLVCAIVKLNNWKDKISKLETDSKNANGKVSKKANLEPTDNKILDYGSYKPDELLAKVDMLEKENKELRGKLGFSDIPDTPKPIADNPKPKDNANPSNKVDELLEAKKLAKPFFERVQEIISVSKNLTDDEFRDAMIDEAVKFLELTGNNKTLFTDTAKTIASKYKEYQDELNKLHKEIYGDRQTYDPNKNWQELQKRYQEATKALQSRYSDYFDFGERNYGTTNMIFKPSLERLKTYLSEDGTKHKAFTIEIAPNWLQALATKYYYNYDYPRSRGGG